MSTNNPLKLKDSLFSDDFEQLIAKTKYNNLVYDFFYLFVTNVCLAEFEAKTAYSKMIEILDEDNSYNLGNWLNNDNKLLLYDHLTKLVKDESNHQIYLEKFLFDKFDDQIKQSKLDEIETNIIDLIKNSNFDNLILRYYIGECYYWTSFYLIFKQSIDLYNKEFFHELLIDETHHTTGFYKIILKIQNDIDFDNDIFIERVKSLRFLMLHFFIDKLKLPNTNTQKDNWWIRLIYDSKWHIQFNAIFLKKCFSVYKLFNPHVNFGEFFEIINKNELDWIPYKS